jgi:hypothetical protein
MTECGADAEREDARQEGTSERQGHLGHWSPKRDQDLIGVPWKLGGRSAAYGRRTNSREGKRDDMTTKPNISTV